MTNKKDIVCPTCGKKDTWKKDNKYKPFCSERCKLIDLGAWAAEDYRVSGGPEDKSSEEDENKE